MSRDYLESTAGPVSPLFRVLEMWGANDLRIEGYFDLGPTRDNEVGPDFMGPLCDRFVIDGSPEFAHSDGKLGRG